MHRRMATGCPAGARLQQQRMIGASDINMAGGNVRPLDLGMKAQAKIGVRDREQILIHRTVRIMADGAAFAHRRVFKDERACLFAMTLRITSPPTNQGASLAQSRVAMMS